MTYKDFNWHPYERLWLDENYEVWPTQSRSDTVGYVREDIVDGLVEALESMYAVAKDVEDRGPLHESWQSDALVEELRKARTALKKLEKLEEKDDEK
jgi:hypothetical protein